MIYKQYFEMWSAHYRPDIVIISERPTGDIETLRFNPYTRYLYMQESVWLDSVIIHELNVFTVTVNNLYTFQMLLDAVHGNVKLEFAYRCGPVTRKYITSEISSNIWRSVDMHNVAIISAHQFLCFNKIGFPA